MGNAKVPLCRQSRYVPLYLNIFVWMLDHHIGMWCHVLHLVFMFTHHVCVQVTWVFHYLGSSHLRHLYILKDPSVIYMTFLLTIPISIYLAPHWHVLLHNCLHISWFVCVLQNIELSNSTKCLGLGDLDTQQKRRFCMASMSLPFFRFTL